MTLSRPSQQGRRIRGGWKVRRPRDGKLRRSKRSSWIGWLALLALVVAAGAWAWPQPTVQRYCYPFQYREIVIQEAARTHLQASMVAAVILQESRFCASATSPVGAQGLMQLMPETGDWVHQHLESRQGRPNLWEPQTNVRLGSTYLSYLAERFNGHQVAYLSAYNAGPEHTLEWMSNAPVAGLRVTDIPFPETREYVEAVLRSERMYRHLYPELETEGTPR
ncbi:lytic transglycosylase domain-containing protein [bacterium]|nr:lytic transglycosylase domain-containing protein [bacterium]